METILLAINIILAVILVLLVLIQKSEGGAVGIGVSLMILTSVTHPPAGGNPIIVIIGSASFDYIISPIIIGSVIVLVFGVILNRFILKKQYPKK